VKGHILDVLSMVLKPGQKRQVQGQKGHRYQKWENLIIKILDREDLLSFLK